MKFTFFSVRNSEWTEIKNDCTWWNLFNSLSIQIQKSRQMGKKNMVKNSFNFWKEKFLLEFYFLREIEKKKFKRSQKMPFKLRLIIALSMDNAVCWMVARFPIILIPTKPISSFLINSFVSYLLNFSRNVNY
jgi:hypothetical protein